jgi:alpha-mannosidase
VTTQTDKPWRIVLVPHTHWDREWYYPYQRYRTRLVGFFDLLLDILDRDPDYKHFMLDGHAILVEDYLEVRPDRRELIERYVREGRLAAGPWYVIPDESLPSGEALVRNLLRGHRVAAELGEVMNVGYIPDPFGQIVHMPAILAGFGIDRCVFWRGTDSSLDTTEFVWESPDGSSVLVKHILGGYGIAAPFPMDHEEFAAKIEFLRSLLQPLAQVPTLLIMWGSDHVPPQRELSSAVRAYNARSADAEIVHGSLPQLFDIVEAQLSRDRAPRRRGEFRSGQKAHLLPGVLSARMWIKQRTFACEQILTRWAEPLTLWSELLRLRLGEAWLDPPVPQGPPSPVAHEALSESGLIDRAWRLLLENQPHDSICGCSVDQTHDEMRPRFDQCDQVGEDLTYESMRRIGAQGIAERVYVFNPIAGPRTDYAQAIVPSKRGVTPIALVDEQGRPSPCQEVEVDDPDAQRRGRTAIGFVAGDVPGFGYRTYEVEYSEKPSSTKNSAPRIENDFFAVEIDPHAGTLTVLEKESGRKYEGLNRIVDGGDRGDEYNYCAPDPDALVGAPAEPPQVRLIESGPARQTLEVRLVYRLPARLGADRRRSARTVRCPARVLVSLSPGVPRIDITTEFENNAEDHRLRVEFPTGVASDVSHAEQHFGVLARPIALPQSDRTWVEEPVGTNIQKTFVDINDGKSGLMIANRGLPEFEALDTSGGVTIALTLLRCVGWLSRQDFPSRKGHAGPPLETPGAQLPGRHVFEYSIIPHAGGWDRAYVEAHRFASPLRARWNNRGTGVLPASASFLDLDGDGLVVTALKRPDGRSSGRAEDGEGAVVRLYNILDRETTGHVRLAEAWTRAEVVDMKEDFRADADVSDGHVHVSLRPNEIVTLRFV